MEDSTTTDRQDQTTWAEIDLQSPLRDIFGFREFRPNQENIVRAILAGRDAFAVMPTGGGKSLCYQLPAAVLPGMCVVISPLISLMKDQVDAARANGLRAEYLNSTLDGDERSRIGAAIHRGELDLLYVAPERLAGGGFFQRLQSVPICFFAIDEAHCISEWGHDFRPDYLNLSQIRQYFPHHPVAAFTATATDRVQIDIIDRLALREPFTLRASFNRPNLYYEIQPKRNIESQLMQFLRNRKDESGIVYRTTRKDVEETAALLTGRGIAARPYHAGLDAEIRQQTQDDFNRDKVQVIVATVAFGMGIDKSNVRFVIHGDLPKNIEGYYQETGRAGRDGEPARCLLLYSRSDTATIRYFIGKIDDSAEREVASDKLDAMLKYASGHTCRRVSLLGYFDEEFRQEDCGHCDICTGEMEQHDATRDAQIVMSAIARTQQRFGATHVVDIVYGAKTKKIRELGHNQIKTYGAGKDKPKRHWNDIIDSLLAQGCLVQTNDGRPILLLTATGQEVLFGRKNFAIHRKRDDVALTPAKSTGRKKAGKSVTLDYDEELFQRLRIVRKDLADDANVPAWMIFSDRTLHEMAYFLPTSKSQMLAINGVGKTKWNSYGKEFVEAIRQHKREHPDQA